MNTQLQHIFNKILNDQMLFDDEVTYLKEALAWVLGLWGYMSIEDVEELIEDVWSEAQDDILDDMPRWRDVNEREIQRFLIQ